jgi:hypothetical protein
MTLVIRLLLLCLALCLPRGTKAQTRQRVTMDIFIRAETDSYFAYMSRKLRLGAFFICAMSHCSTSRMSCT